MVVSTNMSALVTRVAQQIGSPRLVWRTSLSSTQFQLPVSLIVPTFIEPALRASGAVGPGAPLRVAVLRPSSTVAMSIVDTIFEHIRFNGKSALENGDAFRQFIWSDVNADAPKLVDEMLAFAPHVIVYVAQGELVAPYFRPIEERWPKGAKHRPYYVSSASLDRGELFQFIGSKPERRRRFFGVAPPGQTPANAKLTMRYNEIFSPKIAQDVTPAAPYDAIYMLAYAAYVADGAEGRDLSRAIPRLLPPGKPTELGPTRILEAFDTLRSGASIDLAGTMTRLDFDVATGESGGDLSVYCVGVDAHGDASTWIESGARYDGPSNTLVGKLNCP
jgi:hypothetical protein